ncbi:MAG: glycosyltransferase family 4 protein [Cytophagaceae bacterium]|nr:glycosyltransferase family 4 protein [Cytophagaceae bacterium]
MQTLEPDFLEKFSPNRVAFVGNYLPRHCGIATFTYDVFTSFAKEFPQVDSFVVSVNDLPEGYDYPDEVRFDFGQENLADYERAARFLNNKNVELVCLQHEYGIYGGRAGSYILRLLETLTMPVVTTLHTVLRNPNPDQYNTLRQIARLSARLVVMSERGRTFLREIYGVPDQKITVIAHGIPDMPFVDPHFYKDQFDVAGRSVLLTFGLLSPNKGIENVIRALPEVVDKHPELVYLVVGATHPNLLRERGEAYRESLIRLADELGVSDHIRFHNKFVDADELMAYIGAADVYITPYLNPAQITSGTLAYCFGSGKAVISTPYWHAEELLADGNGLLVPFGDSDAIAGALNTLLDNEPLRHAMRKRAYLLGRAMTWKRVIARYQKTFADARQERLLNSLQQALQRKPDRAESIPVFPTLKLAHLFRLTDYTGLAQHARYTLPHYEEGYCTDDNARGLILSLWLEETDLVLDARLGWLTDTFATFLNYAYSPTSRRFRNFMAYTGAWLEEAGSDDSHGRALWALGSLVSRTSRNDLRQWASELFEHSLPEILGMTSPRAWAFALLGISEYLTRFGGDRKVRRIQTELTGKLITLYQAHATPEWDWFEPILTYDNARLCQALLLSNNPEAERIGLRTFGWLQGVQSAPGGHFRPIGNDGFYEMNGQRAMFDQQPVEAAAGVAASIAAWQVTGEVTWLHEARRAFDWFLGRNDLGLSLYDAHSGGCFDGLQLDRVNQNQGAESLLAWLMAYVELKTALESAGTLPALSDQNHEKTADPQLTLGTQRV